MTIQVVPFEPAFREQVAFLQKELWSPDPTRNGAYFEWKFERNPLDRDPPVFVALDGTQVVAMRAFSPTLWRAGAADTTVPILLAGDTVVAPAWRGRGLVHELTRAALAALEGSRYRWLLNLSSGPATFKSYLALGWRPVCALGQVRRRPEPPRWQAPIRAAWQRVRPPRMIFDRLDRRASRPVAGATISALPRPAAMAALAGRAARGKRLGMVRDEAWFAWRFDNPLSRYRFLFAGDDTLDGYLVLHSSATRRGRRVHVIDWEAESPAMFSRLLDAAIVAGGFRDVILWSVSASEEELRVLEARGFRAAPAGVFEGHERPAALLRPVSPSPGDGAWLLDGADALDARTWDFRMVCSDGY